MVGKKLKPKVWGDPPSYRESISPVAVRPLGEFFPFFFSIRIVIEDGGGGEHCSKGTCKRVHQPRGSAPAGLVACTMSPESPGFAQARAPPLALLMLTCNASLYTTGARAYHSSARLAAAAPAQPAAAQSQCDHCGEKVAGGHNPDHKPGCGTSFKTAAK